MIHIGMIYRTIISGGLVFLISCTQFSPAPVPIPVVEQPTNTLGGSGIVKAVPDGDSVLIEFNGKAYDSRLACVDAMEYNAPLGDKSAQYLRESLPKDSSVEVNVVDVDKYGRLVVLAWKDRKLINSEVVRSGNALIYPKYFGNCKGHEEVMLASEEEAKEKQVGYWSLPEQQQIEPWEWRKKNRK